MNSILLPVASCDTDVYRIGVLSIHGDKEEVKRTWVPMENYLSDSIPNSSFEVVPLDYDEFSQKVSNDSIDFFYSNPLLYVEMARLHGAGRIATFQPAWNNSSYVGMGGVIFTRADRDDINSLQDIKGKSFMAVSSSSLGGYLAAAGEFKANDIKEGDFNEITYGESHESVVLAVIEGDADAGTVRTGILESMVREGTIDIGDIKVLNQKEYGSYPYQVSTDLYPDWAFAKTASTPDEISKKVTVALLSMPADSEAAVSMDSSGWAVPADYSSVDMLMRELMYGIYVDYGKITLQQACTQYWYFFIFFILIVALFGVYSHWMLERKKKSQLEASNRLKDLFTDIMRHDLMNPVNVIRGFSDMLYSNENDIEKRESLKMICGQTERLTSMISSAAKLGKLESSEDMEFSRQDIVPVLWMTANSFTTEFKKKNIKLDFRIKGEYNALVNDVIEDVFSNLISNAIKYSPENTTVKLEIEDLDKSFKVMVTDEGEGIPDEAKSLVFDRFKRADKKGIKGTGLGLAIVKRIVELHNGKVGVDVNPEGKGSVFWVVLKKA